MMKISKNTFFSSEEESSERLSEDIVLEIITKLWIKNVFQLTCVSKFWRSVILHPNFLQIYRSQNPNPTALIITVYKEYNSLENISIYHSILKLPSHEEEEAENFVNSLNIKDAIRITQTVNGLVCVCYNDSNNLICLALMSVRTGEILMRLPHSGNHRLARYFLGFEPVNKVYKLLKIGKPIEYFCSQTIDSNCYDLEILTISRNITDMCWIKLPKSNAAPVVFGSRWPCYSFLDTQSFSVNGFLFWIFKHIGRICKEVLISFDVREYKFRTIETPSNFPNLFWFGRFTQFNGQLGLFDREEEGLLPVIYSFDDKEDEEGDSWTRHVITLPCEVVTKFRSEYFYHGRVIPVGNLPTGEILLALVETNEPITSVYSYDYTNGVGTFKRFVVDKFPKECKDKRDGPGTSIESGVPYIHFSVDDGFSLYDIISNQTK